MRGGGTRARNGNMRQRGQVVHGKTLAVNIRSELAVGYARTDGYGARLRVQHHLIEKLQRDLVLSAVGDAVKRMARTEGFQLVAALHGLLNFLYGLGKQQVVGAVLVVAGPIGSRRGWLLSRHQARQYAAGDESAGSLQK